MSCIRSFFTTVAGYARTAWNWFAGNAVGAAILGSAATGAALHMVGVLAATSPFAAPLMAAMLCVFGSMAVNGIVDLWKAPCFNAAATVAVVLGALVVMGIAGLEAFGAVAIIGGFAALGGLARVVELLWAPEEVTATPEAEPAEVL